MALTLGTNVGFVLTAPTADPAGGDTTIDGSSVVVKDTSPAGAIKITEIGWYRGSGTNTANFEIALYSDSAGVADARLYVDATNSSSAGGWITTAVDWSITPSTAYWLGLQMDAHTGSSTVDNATSGGSGTDVRTSQTTLNDPYGGGAVADADGMYAIYALYQSAPTVALNSPADASSDSDTTPTFDFTGTDAQGNDVRYEVQIATSAFTEVSASNLTSGTDIDGGSSSTTASVSPSSNKLQLLAIASRTAITADPNEPTVTGNGLTWVSIGSVVYDNSSSTRRRITLFRAMGASPSSGTISIDFGGQAQTSVRWSLEELTNADTSGTNGSGAIVQTVTNLDASATVNTLTVTLAAFSNTNNATFGTFASGDAETLVVGSGFTSLSEGDSGDSNIHLLTEFKNSNDTSVDMSKATGSELGGVAVEIKSLTQVLLDKVSGTDAGFANPDNGGDTDPFTSGENIQYTVQSALAAGTYYWRVRGIDPSGSNTYGAWTSSRSFTISSAVFIPRLPYIIKQSIIRSNTY